MANEHPFQVLFETLGRVPAAHAESVNRQAYEVLSGILTVPIEKSGRCILLRAPRAGHGKTHLLSRIQQQLGASHEFVPIQSTSGCRIDGVTVTDDTLRRLVRQLPASGGLTVLDLVTRRLFASALQPLVASGEVPCQDREGALAALRTRPVETFDFNHPNAVTAHWARENFEVLGQRLSLELAQRCDLPLSGISFWVDALFQFASAPLESPNRVRILGESVHSGSGFEMERLEALLSLVSMLMRVVLIADDLEGFSADETAALRLAAFLGSLRHSVERLDVILSLNQDIWQNAFMPRLSGGLADRLSEVVVELEPLTEAEMEELLNSRVPGLGRIVLERLDAKAAGTHARGLIRAAGAAWLKAAATENEPPTALETPLMNPAAGAQASITPTVESAPVPNSPVFSVPDPVQAAEPVREWPTPEFTSAIADPPASQFPEASPFQGYTPQAEFSPSPSPAANAWQDPLSHPAGDPSPLHDAVLAISNEDSPANSPFQQGPLASVPDWQQAALQGSFTPHAQAETVFPPNDALYPLPTALEPQFNPPGSQQEIHDSRPFILPSADIHPPHPRASEPIFKPAETPATSVPPPTPEETDRVDDLLRQFRERYGRGSL